MNKKIRDLSKYIDKLNAEKKPNQHRFLKRSQQEEELFETVRFVHSLKEHTLPEGDYGNQLARNVEGKLTKKNPCIDTKRRWYFSVAIVSAIIMMTVLLNFITPFSNVNTVRAMEKAFQEVKTYHGILEIVEINAEGKVSTQAKLEVWADKDDRYFIKNLDGSQEGLTTVNNGQKKWQLRPDEKQAYIFSAFPDPYRYTFELGKEIDDAKNALESEVVGEEMVAGRKAIILEVSPQGGAPYRLWIDQKTKLPLQKQSAMQNSLQYRVTYTEIDFIDTMPQPLMTYSLPTNFEEIDTNPEQIVNNLEEAQDIVGFSPKVPDTIPAGYRLHSIAVEASTKKIKLNFIAQNKEKRVVIVEKINNESFKSVPTEILGKVGESMAEIQSPVQEVMGILGSGPYADATNMNSIRWNSYDLEYAVVGNASLEEVIEFVDSLDLGEVQLSLDNTNIFKPQIEVAVDLEVEKNDQKSVDAGHSPWKLDPAFVAQVFVSLLISPEGIVGDYPIKEEDLNIIYNTGVEAIVEVSGDKTPVKKVYLKRLIRQYAWPIFSL